MTNQTQTNQGLPQIGDTLHGRYEIIDLLGKGGFGAVYLARQLSMDRNVALKVLVAHAMKVDEMIARFRREVLAIRNLSHPNTIQIFDFNDSPDGMLYYAMEHVNGPTLKSVLRKDAPLSPARVAHITKQVLKSLSEAHSHGIVHRDLKPANIMLADMHGETDFVKVLDFGIAKLMDGTDDDSDSEQLTNAGVLVGTINYMSPEQISSDPIGPPSDIYALGLIGVEMLTGLSVFAKSGKWEILHKQISDEPVDVPDFVKADPVGQIFWKALEKKPQNRFQTADEMRAALNRLDNVSRSPLVASEWSGANPNAVVEGGLPISQSGPISVSNLHAQRPGNTPVSQSSPISQSGSISGLHIDEDDEATMMVDSGSIQSPLQQPKARLPEQFSTGNLGAQNPLGTPSTDGLQFDVVEQSEEGTSGKVIAIVGVIAVVLVLAVGGAVAFLKSDNGEVAANETPENGEVIPDEIPYEIPDVIPEAKEVAEPVEVAEPNTVALSTGSVVAKVYDEKNNLLGETPLDVEVTGEKMVTLKAADHKPMLVVLNDAESSVEKELIKIPTVAEKKETEKKETVAKKTEKKTTKKKTEKKETKKKSDWIEIKKKKEKKKDVPVF